MDTKERDINPRKAAREQGAPISGKQKKKLRKQLEFEERRARRESSAFESAGETEDSRIRAVPDAPDSTQSSPGLEDLIGKREEEDTATTRANKAEGSVSSLRSGRSHSSVKSGRSRGVEDALAVMSKALVDTNAELRAQVLQLQQQGSAKETKKLAFTGNAAPEGLKFSKASRDSLMPSMMRGAEQLPPSTPLPNIFFFFTRATAHYDGAHGGNLSTS